jgi:hypothetical protein
MKTIIIPFQPQFILKVIGKETLPRQPNKLFLIKNLTKKAID